MSLQIRKAKREKLKAVVNLMSASGSGKSLSALFIAYGLMQKAYPDTDVWDKIGVIDTEHRRMLYYAGNEKAGVYIPDESFLHIDLTAPYTVDRYVEAMDMLKGAGCEVIIIDSLSHAWAKEGGLLELQQGFGGRYQDWAKVAPHEKKLYKAIFENDVHVITTMRTKQEYALEKNEVDKLEVRKLGTKPVQRDDMEYEYMLVFQLDQNHMAQPSKDNSGLFLGQPFRITPETGHILYEWLELGIDVRAMVKKEREDIIESISKAMAEYTDVALLIPELEQKAKMKLEDMPLTLLKRASDLADNAIRENNEALEEAVLQDEVEQDK